MCYISHVHTYTFSYRPQVSNNIAIKSIFDPEKSWKNPLNILNATTGGATLNLINSPRNLTVRTLCSALPPCEALLFRICP